MTLAGCRTDGTVDFEIRTCASAGPPGRRREGRGVPWFLRSVDVELANRPKADDLHGHSVNMRSARQRHGVGWRVPDCRLPPDQKGLAADGRSA